MLINIEIYGKKVAIHNICGSIPKILSKIDAALLVKAVRQSVVCECRASASLLELYTQLLVLSILD